MCMQRVGKEQNKINQANNSNNISIAMEKKEKKRRRRRNRHKSDEKSKPNPPNSTSLSLPCPTPLPTPLLCSAQTPPLRQPFTGGSLPPTPPSPQPATPRPKTLPHCFSAHVKTPPLFFSVIVVVHLPAGVAPPLFRRRRWPPCTAITVILFPVSCFSEFLEGKTLTSSHMILIALSLNLCK